MSAGKRLAALLLALLPLLLTPLLAYLLGEGWLNLGGGEKDILLVLPWLIASLTFALSGGVLILRGHALRQWVSRAALVTLLMLTLCWVLAFVVSLGIMP